MTHVFLQRPVQMGKGLGTARKPHPATQIVSSLFAKVAVLAHAPDLHSDAVSDFERTPSRQVGSEGGNDAAGLVTQDHWLADFEDAICTVIIVVH